MELEFIQRLVTSGEGKIVFLVIDGLGGLGSDPGGKTELETAKTPFLDKLAAEGLCGLHEPIGPGITPGSGPSHLAVFGYDTIKYQIGRGVLSALGIDFDLQPQDVAARGNFCTLDEQGRVTDRRAGRISTETNKTLCEKLRQIDIPGVDLFVRTVKEHRFLLVLRGDGLSGDVCDTDPQQTGLKPIEPAATSPQGQTAAQAVKTFTDRARCVLADDHPANMVLLRGFAQRPDWPLFTDVFGVRAAAIAGYPMYKGLAKLLGMTVLATAPDMDSEMQALQTHWSDYDFFYVHFKPVDSAGEDGDFDRKVRMIEQVDAAIPKLQALDPAVIVVTGDHSTPAVMKFHSWHPVPTLLWSKICRTDTVSQFGERACMAGGLGANLPAAALMPLALANAQRLEKFGA